MRLLRGLLLGDLELPYAVLRVEYDLPVLNGERLLVRGSERYDVPPRSTGPATTGS